MEKKYDKTIVSVKDMLLQFIRQNKRMFFNERDLQMYLALKLEKSGDFDEVFMEYHLPKGFNEVFDLGYKAWQTETPSIDIVLKIKGEEKYIAIELKNKLKAISGECTRFGQTSQKKELVKNQSAQNIGRYQFWKDVKRLELLKESYKNVIGGIALFLTNDANYLKTTKGADYEDFGMSENLKKDGVLEWGEFKKVDTKTLVNNKKRKKSPPIKLSNSYSPRWENNIFTIQDTVHFHCCTVIV